MACFVVVFKERVVWEKNMVGIFQRLFENKKDSGMFSLVIFLKCDVCLQILVESVFPCFYYNSRCCDKMMCEWRCMAICMVDVHFFEKSCLKIWWNFFTYNISKCGVWSCKICRKCFYMF